MEGDERGGHGRRPAGRLAGQHAAGRRRKLEDVLSTCPTAAAAATLFLELLSPKACDARSSTPSAPSRFRSAFVFTSRQKVSLLELCRLCPPSNDDICRPGHLGIRHIKRSSLNDVFFPSPPLDRFYITTIGQSHRPPPPPGRVRRGWRSSICKFSLGLI